MIPVDSEIHNSTASGQGCFGKAVSCLKDEEELGFQFFFLKALAFISRFLIRIKSSFEYPYAHEQTKYTQNKHKEHPIYYRQDT